MKKITLNKAEKVASLITKGIESWVNAGEILVEMLDKDGISLNDISEKISVPTGILGRFEQLGRKQLVPSLLIANYPASKHLQRLPYSEQDRLIDGSIEVLTCDGGDRIKVSTKNLTSQQCKQVFSSSSVRDMGGQRAWVESTKRKKDSKTTESGMTYHIERGKVIFDKGCTMKASQLVNILAQLTPSK